MRYVNASWSDVARLSSLSRGNDDGGSLRALLSTNAHQRANSTEKQELRGPISRVILIDLLSLASLTETNENEESSKRIVVFLRSRFSFNKDTNYLATQLG